MGALATGGLVLLLVGFLLVIAAGPQPAPAPSRRGAHRASRRRPAKSVVYWRLQWAVSRTGYSRGRWTL
nr:hypothetical protein GCM10020241_43270 [Streptoalloteichus tenebrarius]